MGRKMSHLYVSTQSLSFSTLTHFESLCWLLPHAKSFSDQDNPCLWVEGKYVEGNLTTSPFRKNNNSRLSPTVPGFWARLQYQAWNSLLWRRPQTQSERSYAVKVVPWLHWWDSHAWLNSSMQGPVLGKTIAVLLPGNLYSIFQHCES